MELTQNSNSNLGDNSPISSEGETFSEVNIDGSGSMRTVSKVADVPKGPSGKAMFKLLLLLAVPALIVGVAAWVYGSYQDDQVYMAENNVLMSVPMKSVNWQDIGNVFEPIIPLEIKTPDGYEEWEFLLDSGAVISSLPRNWADKIGLDLADMKRSTFRGFGNSRSFAYHGEMVVSMAGDDRVLPVVFTEAVGTKSLLGRKGFFESYSIMFNIEDRVIEVRE